MPSVIQCPFCLHIGECPHLYSPPSLALGTDVVHSSAKIEFLNSGHLAAECTICRKGMSNFPWRRNCQSVGIVSPCVSACCQPSIESLASRGGGTFFGYEYQAPKGYGVAFGDPGAPSAQAGETRTGCKLLDWVVCCRINNAFHQNLYK